MEATRPGAISTSEKYASSLAPVPECTATLNDEGASPHSVEAVRETSFAPSSRTADGRRAHSLYGRTRILSCDNGARRRAPLESATLPAHLRPLGPIPSVPLRLFIVEEFPASSNRPTTRMWDAPSPVIHRCDRTSASATFSAPGGSECNETYERT